MKVTYFIEVLSSWCYWAEPAWAELKSRYADRVDFSWKIALMNSGDFPTSVAQCEWFYRRSGTIVRSPFMLNAGWFEADRKGDYIAPNLVAEAGKDLGFSDDRLRLALTDAALREGKKIGGMAEAIEVAAYAVGLDPNKLRTLAESTEVLDRVKASTAQFHSLQIAQRPAFLFESEIGDKAVISGVARVEPLAAIIDSMLADAAAYAGYQAHFGTVP